MASIKPGTSSPSRVTWAPFVATTLPRMVKVFCCEVACEGDEAFWRQPTNRAIQTGRNKSLRDTKETPESMIMAGTQVCGGGRVGRTKQSGCSIFGADALWACAGR